MDDEAHLYSKEYINFLYLFISVFEKYISNVMVLIGDNIST